MATHAGRYDDCEHRRAYERALAYALTQVTTQANAHQPVKVTADYLTDRRVHEWDDDRAYFCPSGDCVCHSTRG